MWYGLGGVAQWSATEFYPAQRWTAYMEGIFEHGLVRLFQHGLVTL